MKKGLEILCALLAACGAPAAPEAPSAPEVSSAPEAQAAAAGETEAAADAEEPDEDAEWFLSRAKREIQKYGYKVVPGDDFKNTMLKVKVSGDDRMGGLREIISELTKKSMRNALPPVKDSITGDEIEGEEGPTEVQVTVTWSGSSYTVYYKYDK